MQTLAERLDILPQVGRLEWIGVRSARRKDVTSLPVATLIAEQGIEGDHHAGGRPGRKRQVTLIQSEHLAAVASFLHRDPLPPELLRRNLVVSGINLLALKGREFRIGPCLLSHTGSCDPCSLMESQLGPGGLNAMRGHGGITAMVLEGGVIRVGDEIRAS